MPNKLIITMDSHALVSYGTCARSWAYENRENLRLIKTGTTKRSQAPNLGSAFHKLLEIYYTLKETFQGVSKADAIQGTLDLFDRLEDFHKENNLSKDELDFLTMRFSLYVNKYWKGDQRPLFVNGKAALEVGFSKVFHEDEFVIYVLEGKIDGIFRLGNGSNENFIRDHKTQDRVSTLYGFKPQFVTYIWATGLRRLEVNYCGVQKTVTEDTFRRDLFYYNDLVIERWKQWVSDKFNDIYINVLSRVKSPFGVNGFTEEIIEIYKELKAVDYEPEFSACGGEWESNKCPYTRLCEEPEELHEVIKGQYYEKVKPWRPW